MHIELGGVELPRVVYGTLGGPQLFLWEELIVNIILQYNAVGDG
jgi:hypothetical protein